MNSSHPEDILDEVELLGTPGGDRLRARFSGPFEGTTVRWDATLYTPQAWAREFGVAAPQHNIIEISERDISPLPIQICLKVVCIDRPTVRKAVMMVRQYKRLKRGIHQYG